MSTVQGVLAAALAAGTAVLFAALGELLAERAGILNLGVEGMMLVGAVSGFAGAQWTGMVQAGVVLAMFAGGVMALLYAALTVTLRTNQVVTGLAFSLGGAGISAFFGKPYVGVAPADSFGKIELGPLTDIPFLGPILFRQDVLVYTGIALTALTHLYLSRTRPGLVLRAVGDNPGAVDALGMSVPALRYAHVIAGGALAGLGGAYLSLAYTPSWIENMTGGRGWIAIALVIFATWRPWWALGGAYLFGAADALGPRLQAAGVRVDEYLLAMAPYLLTLGVLVLISRASLRRRLGVPAALGIPYDREER